MIASLFHFKPLIMNKTIKKDQLPMLLMLYPDEKRSFKEQWNKFKYSYKIEDVRVYFSQCLETCLCSDHSNFSDAMDRSNIAFFFGELMALLEAKYQKDLKQDEQYRQFATGKK